MPIFSLFRKDKLESITSWDITVDKDALANFKKELSTQGLESTERDLSRQHHVTVTDKNGSKNYYILNEEESKSEEYLNNPSDYLEVMEKKTGRTIDAFIQHNQLELMFRNEAFDKCPTQLVDALKNNLNQNGFLRTGQTFLTNDCKIRMATIPEASSIEIKIHNDGNHIELVESCKATRIQQLPTDINDNPESLPTFSSPKGETIATVKTTSSLSLQDDKPHFEIKSIEMNGKGNNAKNFVKQQLETVERLTHRSKPT